MDGWMNGMFLSPSLVNRLRAVTDDDYTGKDAHVYPGV